MDESTAQDSSLDTAGAWPAAAGRSSVRARKNRRRSSRAPVAAFAGVALIAAGGAYLRLRPIPVTVSPVVEGRAVEAVYATGTVEAKERARVKAKSAGTLVELRVKKGDHVRAGDLLARLDNPAAAADLERERAGLRAASVQASVASPRVAALKSRADSTEADLAIAREDLRRSKDLYGSGSVAYVEVDRQKSRVDALQGALEAARAEERAARIDLDANQDRAAAQVRAQQTRLTDTEVRAPISGTVLARFVDPGEVVAVDQALLALGDTSALRLEVNVDEADVARLSDGSDGRPKTRAAVSLRSFGNRVFAGVLEEIDPDADRDKKVFLVKVGLVEPPEGLRSGMSAEVNFVVREQRGALLVPASAWSEGAVWVAKDGRAQRRSVEVGIADLLSLQVTSGLAAGEEVVVSGGASLREGARLATTEQPPDKSRPEPDITQPLKTGF
jgi:HlyD family secretion protein